MSAREDTATDDVPDQIEPLQFRNPNNHRNIVIAEKRTPEEPPATAVEVMSAAADVQGGYWDLVRRAIAERLRYPIAARRRGLEDTVVLRLTIHSSGRLIAAVPVSGKGSRVLAEAALHAVRRAAPFPPPAEHGITMDVVTVELPIRFTMDGRGFRSAY